MRFNCHFSRTVHLDHETETTTSRNFQRKNVKQKYGVLKYDFKVEHEPEGGKIRIKIEPLHKIKDVVAK